MLSLFKRSNGVYYIQYGNKEKRRWKSTGTGLKSEALKRLKEFETLQTNVPPSNTLDAFIEEFLAYAQATFAPKTVEMYRLSLKRLSSFAGKKPLISFSSRDADRFHVTRLQQKVSPVTINIETRTLRAAFATALRWKMIQENPWREIKPLRVPEEQPAVLCKEDFTKLIENVGENWLKELIRYVEPRTQAVHGNDGNRAAATAAEVALVRAVGKR